MKNTDKREEIMRAALELIAEHGFHGAPMAMIADRAGVGAGTIYRYFESKDVLINEMYRELEGKLLSYLREGYSAATPSGPVSSRRLSASEVFYSQSAPFPLHGTVHELPLRHRPEEGSAAGSKRRRRSVQESPGGGNGPKRLEGIALFHPALCPDFRALDCPDARSILGLISVDDALIMQVVEACWDGVKR